MRKLGIFIVNIFLVATIAQAQTDTTKQIKADTTVKGPTGPVRTIDKIAAVVGSSIILQSDIELQYAQYLVSGQQPPPDFKAVLLQNQLTQKLLAQQAVIDSVQVKDEDVDADVERRMRAFIQRAGGQEKLEAFLGRSVIQYKDEIRPDIKESMIAQRMRQKITEKVNVTPQDIKRFYELMPKDSLPTFNKEVEVGEIVFDPKLTKDEKQYYKDKAEELRQQNQKRRGFWRIGEAYTRRIRVLRPMAAIWVLTTVLRFRKRILRR
jgi:peptidyl-prolyl cis-trans isomerase SurA